MHMTQKQIIYQAILSRALPHMRNVSTWSWWRRLRDRSTYFETQFIHNIWPSLCEPAFVDHDLWFLNNEARLYCKECSTKLSPLYLAQVAHIRELFALVPPELRSKLLWNGPNELASES